MDRSCEIMIKYVQADIRSRNREEMPDTPGSTTDEGLIMNYFPFYLDITNKTFLIIGGGPVAHEKVDRLRLFTQDIIVVAPRTKIEGVFTTKPRRGYGKTQILCKEYAEEDLDLADFVVAATGIREVDRRVAVDCRRRGIPVNVVDDREYCDFIFPGIIKRDSLTVAISTSGTSPAYAMQLRKEIEVILPDEIGPILTRMGELRGTVSARIPDQKARAAVYRKILSELIETENRMNDEKIGQIIEMMAHNRTNDREIR